MRHRSLKHRRWLTATALLALVAGGAVWLGQPADSGSPFSDRVTDQTGAADAQAREPKLAAESAGRSEREHRQTQPTTVASSTPATLGPDPFAPSLAGTDIDGALKADPNGELIVDLETRDFFDYFLSTVGEVSPDDVLDRIQTLAVNSLPPEAAQQAMALLDQYLNYKQQALALQNTPLDPARQQDPAYQQEMLHNAFMDLKQLRQAVFSPEAHQAFFGLEEAYGEYTLATLDIARRTDLTHEAKTSLVAWHRDQLPELLQRTERRLLQSNQENRQRVELMKTAGSPQRAGQELMDQGMSPEAADSVTAYLQERQDFDARFEHFREALAQVNEAGLAAKDQSAQQARLLNQHFPDSKQQTWARLKMLGSNSP